MKNIFTTEVSSEVINRINKLQADSTPNWGKMNSGQMFAHCNVPYEMVYESEKHPRPNAIARFMIKLLAKNQVVSEKPYPKNGRTAPQFIMTDNKDFDVEKTRLISYIGKTQELGEAHFDGKESNAMGALSKTEWNNMFYKHLDHHLNQFGV